MSEAQYRVGLRALETIGHIAPLDGLSCLVKAASEEFEVYVIPYQSIEALGEQAEGGDLEDAALLWCQGPEMADRQPLDLRGLAESVLAGRVEALFFGSGIKLEVSRHAGVDMPENFKPLFGLDVAGYVGDGPWLDLALVAAVEAWPDDFAALLREVHRGSP